METFFHLQLVIILSQLGFLSVEFVLEKTLFLNNTQNMIAVHYIKVYHLYIFGNCNTFFCH